MDSQFTDCVGHGLVDNVLRVVRFEFPYMPEHRRGRRFPPDRPGRAHGDVSGHLGRAQGDRRRAPILG